MGLLPKVNWKRLRRQLRYLAGYLDFEEAGPSPRAADFDHATRPLLLLHGFLASRRAVEVLEKRLRRDGYTVLRGLVRDNHRSVRDPSGLQSRAHATL